MGSRSFAAGLAILALSAAGGARAQYADNLSRGKAAAPVSDLKITISPNSDLSSEYFGYFD